MSFWFSLRCFWALIDPPPPPCQHIYDKNNEDLIKKKYGSCNESQAWGVKLKLNDLSPRHLLMILMAVGVVTGDIWQPVNHTTITGEEGRRGGKHLMSPAFFYLAQLLPFNYHQPSDLGVCGSSMRSQQWASDRRLFTSNTSSSLLLPYCLSHQRGGAQGHRCLTSCARLHHTFPTNINRVFLNHWPGRAV